GQLHESRDVDAVAGVGERDALELLVGDGDELAFADLIAPHDVLPVNDLIVEGTVPLVLDRRLALAVEETEAHILLLRGGVQFDRERDEAEADVSPPVRSHLGIPPLAGEAHEPQSRIEYRIAKIALFPAPHRGTVDCIPGGERLQAVPAVRPSQWRPHGQTRVR